MRWTLLVVLLLAGCLEATPDEAGPLEEPGAGPEAGPVTTPRPEAETREEIEEAPTDEPVPEQPTSINYTKKIHWDQEVAAMLMGSSNWQEERLEVPVATGAASIHGSLQWDDDVQDVDLHANAPQPCPFTVGGTVDCAAGLVLQDGTAGFFTDLGGHRGAPDAPSEVDIGNGHIERFGCTEEVCTWRFEVWGKDLVEDLDMVLTVTVHYPEGVPDGVLQET